MKEQSGTGPAKISLFSVTFYDYMNNVKKAYCVGTHAQVAKWVSKLGDCYNPLIIDKGDHVNDKATDRNIEIFNCIGETV